VSTVDPFARGTITANNPFAFTATFNNAAVNFIGRSINVTDTASGADSWIDSISLGGGRVWGVNKAGQQYVAAPVLWSHAAGAAYSVVQYVDNSGWMFFANGVGASYGANTTQWAPGYIRSPKVGGIAHTPSIAGNGTLVANSFNVQGKVLSTATGAITITLTFGGVAYDVAPSCFAVNETAGALQPAASTASTLTISGSATTGDSIAYACIGR
jgi:hypothetical protein